MNNNCGCDDPNIYAGSAWYWLLAPVDVSTGLPVTGGDKPTVTYSFSGGADTSIEATKVVWGSYDENGYVTSGPPTYTLRVEVPPQNAGLMRVTATFANPAHVVTVERQIW